MTSRNGCQNWPTSAPNGSLKFFLLVDSCNRIDRLLCGLVPKPLQATSREPQITRDLNWYDFPNQKRTRQRSAIVGKLPRRSVCQIAASTYKRSCLACVSVCVCVCSRGSRQSGCMQTSTENADMGILLYLLSNCLLYVHVCIHVYVYIYIYIFTHTHTHVGMVSLWLPPPSGRPTRRSFGSWPARPSDVFWDHVWA